MQQRRWKPRGRLRRVLRRSSLAWWGAALLLGYVTASLVSSNLADASRAADKWGSERRVWVVQRPVPAGAVLLVGDARLERWPKGVIPKGALDGSTSPLGEATRVALLPGEVVATERLAGRGAHGLAALITAGHRAIAVRNDESMPTVRAGDRVDIIATFDVEDGSTEPSIAVASNAEVLTVSPRTITVAVTSREAPRVAFALARAAVTLSLRGGASEPARSR